MDGWASGTATDTPGPVRRAGTTGSAERPAMGTRCVHSQGPGEESNLACRRGEIPRSAPPCSGSCRMSTSPFVVCGGSSTRLRTTVSDMFSLVADAGEVEGRRSRDDLPSSLRPRQEVARRRAARRTTSSTTVEQAETMAGGCGSRAGTPASRSATSAVQASQPARPARQAPMTTRTSPASMISAGPGDTSTVSPPHDRHDGSPGPGAGPSYSETSTGARGAGPDTDLPGRPVRVRRG